LPVLIVPADGGDLAWMNTEMVHPQQI